MANKTIPTDIIPPITNTIKNYTTRYSFCQARLKKNLNLNSRQRNDKNGKKPLLLANIVVVAKETPQGKMP